MQSVLTSPTEPGIKPMKASSVLIGSPIMLVSCGTPSPAWIAACPSGVAPVKASVTVPAPMPNAGSVATNAASPDIFDG